MFIVSSQNGAHLDLFHNNHKIVIHTWDHECTNVAEASFEIIFLTEYVLFLITWITQLSREKFPNKHCVRVQSPNSIVNVLNPAI